MDLLIDFCLMELGQDIGASLLNFELKHSTFHPLWQNLADE